MSSTAPGDAVCARSGVAAAASPPPTMFPNSRLVRRWMFGMIDHEHFDGLLLSLDLQSELLLDGSEQRRAQRLIRRRRLRLSQPELERHVVQPVDAARIDQR